MSKTKESKKRGAWPRYTKEFKQKVLAFVDAYNKEFGRGGIPKGAAEFNVSEGSIINWRKQFGKTSAAVAEKAQIDSVLTTVTRKEVADNEAETEESDLLQMNCCPECGCDLRMYNTAIALAKGTKSRMKL